MKHPAFQKPDSILEKLRQFHQVHETPLDRVLADLKTAVEQLPYNTCNREAEVVAEVLSERASRRGVVQIGAVLPAVLARLQIKMTEDNEHKDRS